jgi:hypothetical protein
MPCPFCRKPVTGYCIAAYVIITLATLMIVAAVALNFDAIGQSLQSSNKEHRVRIAALAPDQCRPTGGWHEDAAFLIRHPHSSNQDRLAISAFISVNPSPRGTGPRSGDALTTTARGRVAELRWLQPSPRIHSSSQDVTISVVVRFTTGIRSLSRAAESSCSDLRSGGSRGSNGQSERKENQQGKEAEVGRDIQQQYTQVPGLSGSDSRFVSLARTVTKTKSPVDRLLVAGREGQDASEPRLTTFQHSKQSATGRASETVALMTLSRKRSGDTRKPDRERCAIRQTANDGWGSICAREGFCGEPKGDDPQWNRQSVRFALNADTQQRSREALNHPVMPALDRPCRNPETLCTATTFAGVDEASGGAAALVTPRGLSKTKGANHLPPSSCGGRSFESNRQNGGAVVSIQPEMVWSSLVARRNPDSDVRGRRTRTELNSEGFTIGCGDVRLHRAASPALVPREAVPFAVTTKSALESHPGPQPIAKSFGMVA